MRQAYKYSSTENMDKYLALVESKRWPTQQLPVVKLMALHIQTGNSSIIPTQFKL